MSRMHLFNSFSNGIHVDPNFLDYTSKLLIYKVQESIQGIILGL